MAGLLSPGRANTRAWLPYVAFALLVTGIKWLMIAHFGTPTPSHDQWDGEADHLYRPFLQGALGWQDLVRPFNEHRILMTRLLDLLLFRLNGEVWNPLLQVAINSLLHVAALTALLYFLRDSYPQKFRLVFWGAATLLLGLPLAVENLLIGFQSQFYFFMLFSFVFLWAVATQPALSRHWWLGQLCGLLGVLSLASGEVTLAAGAGLVIVRVVRLRRFTVVDAAQVVVWLAVVVLLLHNTPVAAYEQAMRAQAPLPFFIALLREMSWPGWPGFVLVIYFPLLGFMLRHLRQPRGSDAGHAADWLLFALGLWMLGQFVAIAYARAMTPLASRYVDIFMVGLFLNMVCLLRRQSVLNAERAAASEKTEAPYMPFFQVWALAIMIGLVVYGIFLVHEVGKKQQWNVACEVNVRAYLQTHDYAILNNNPYPLIPYADPAYLHELLDQPVVVSFLPPNLVAANGERQPVLVTLFLGDLQALALLLISGGGVLLGVYAGGGRLPGRANPAGGES
jgi:hypothetical protein